MPPPKTAGSPRGTVHGASSHDLIKFTIRAAPLPTEILEFVLDNLIILRRLQKERQSKEVEATGQVHEIDGAEGETGEEEEDVQADVARMPTVKPDQFWTTLKEKCKAAGGEWSETADKIWAFGPHGAGACLLVDARKSGAKAS